MGRNDKNLGKLCRLFVSLYSDERSSEILLDASAERLGIARRRIYDIVNILESIGVVSRLSKNTYSWNGVYKIAETIESIKKDLPVSKIRKKGSLYYRFRDFTQLLIHH